MKGLPTACPDLLIDVTSPHPYRLDKPLCFSPPLLFVAGMVFRRGCWEQIVVPSSHFTDACNFNILPSTILKLACLFTMPPAGPSICWMNSNGNANQSTTSVAFSLSLSSRSRIFLACSRGFSSSHLPVIRHGHQNLDPKGWPVLLSRLYHTGIQWYNQYPTPMQTGCQGIK